MWRPKRPLREEPCHSGRWGAVGCGADQLAFARPRPGARRSSRAEAPECAVVECADRSISEPVVEDAYRPHGIAFLRFDDAILVFGMTPRLICYDESCPHPRRLCTQSEDRRDPASVSDPASGDHRCRRHRVHDRRDEREGPDRTPDMSAGIETLRHDDVHTGLDGELGLLGATDVEHHERSGRMRFIEVRTPWRQGGPVVGDEVHASFEAGRKPLPLIPLQDEVGAERALGQGLRFPHAGVDRTTIQERSPSIPRPPALDTAAASSGQLTLPIGA